MNHLIKETGLEDKIICDSAGTSSYHLGAPPDRRMNAAAMKRGLQLKGKKSNVDIAMVLGRLMLQINIRCFQNNINYRISDKNEARKKDMYNV